MAIKRFRDEYHFLCNFEIANVEYKGLTYSNNEAAFQAQKTPYETIKLGFTTMNPAESKVSGRKLHLRPDWDEVRDQIMYEIVLAKFTQNPDLKAKLLATGDEEIIEGTTGWHDNYWGNCECINCKDIPGQNHLGQTLMRVRQELQER